jgi:hypothetical protein
MGVEDRAALPAWTERAGLSRPEQAVSRAAATDSAQGDADWADPVVGAADQGVHLGDSQADRDRDRPRTLQRQQCTQASPRFHHQPPDDEAARHTAHQMACHSARPGHDERGAATAGAFAISVPAPSPSPSPLRPSLAVAELAGPARVEHRCAA